MAILCTICGRGGSVGVKNKNIRQINGKPLIGYTIEAAINSGLFDKVVVSTDSENIAKIALEFGAEVPFMRPVELSTSAAGKVPVIRHALKYVENASGMTFDEIVDLDITSPLRTKDDIISCIEERRKNDYDIVFSVCDPHKNPYFDMVEIDESGCAHLCKQLNEGVVLSRQVAPKVYEINASIYVYKRDFLLLANSVLDGKAGISIMPPERSVEIDCEMDFAFVEFCIKSGYINIEV